MFVIITKELAGIISGETEGHLGQIVGSEGEELCLLCNLIGKERCSRDFDHGSDMILDIGILFLLYLLCCLYHNIFDKLKLFLLAYKRNHDLGNNVISLFRFHFNGCFHNSSCLHSGNFRIGNSKTASSVSHHGVEFMERITDFLYLLRCHHHLNGEIINIILLGGNKLM